MRSATLWLLLQIVTIFQIATAQNATNKCPTLPTTKVLMNFSKEFVDTATEAMQLNIWASESVSGPIELLIEDLQKFYDFFEGFSDVDDQVVVAKPFDQDICYGVFAPTHLANPLDLVWQNLNPLFRIMEGTNCWVRRSFYNAYFSRSYFDEFNDALHRCLGSCRTDMSSKPCDLVLTGYSQGAALAVIGSIVWATYHPLVLTYGSTQAIVRVPLLDIGTCDQFEADNHYLFVNVINGYYDRVAMQPSPFFGRHIGHLLLLDETNHVVGYPGFNAGKHCRAPLSYTAHYPYYYLERLQFLKERGCFPVPVAKWPAGHRCNYDDECDSLHCRKLPFLFGECK